MEPKFQSSFIPKGPIGSSVADTATGDKGKHQSLLSFLALIIFILSIVLAAGVFGYKFYLKYSIENMGTALEEARSNLQSETISELMYLDSRIVSTKELVSKHKVLTPLFEFLELSTPKTVRFNNFNFSVAEAGIELSMIGEARGYSALAFTADIFNKTEFFKDPVFSDLRLNDRGDVVFSFRAIVDPKQVLYTRQIEPIPDANINPSIDLELQ